LISVPGCSLSAGRAVSPQDMEGNGRIISHEENVNFIFEESRTLLSNQLVFEDTFQK
jgi:hypothetical protein